MIQNAIVIDLNRLRARRAAADALVSPDIPDPNEEDRTDLTRSVARGRLRALSRRVAEAARDWGALTSPLSEEELTRHLPQIISDVAKDEFFQRETRIPALAAALRERFGDASLSRAALLTPQDLLDLPGVGPAVLERLLGVFSGSPALTVLEIVTGRGKARMRVAAAPPDAFFELSSGLPGHPQLRM